MATQTSTSNAGDQLLHSLWTLPALYNVDKLLQIYPGRRSSNDEHVVIFIRVHWSPYLPSSCFTGSSVSFSSPLSVDNWLGAQDRYMFPQSQRLCPRCCWNACGLLTYYVPLLCLVPTDMPVPTVPAYEASESGESDWVDSHITLHFKLQICWKGYCCLKRWLATLPGRSPGGWSKAHWAL